MLGECRRRVLSNGLRVVGVESPVLHSFVCSVHVRVGPRFEAPGQAGLSHFLEHMIMQGSESFPTSAAIVRSVEDLGGVVDAGTHTEYMSIVFGVHRKHWRAAMEIASDVILRPLFDEAEIEQEKLIIAQEISQHRDKDGRNISVSELGHCIVFRGKVWEAGTLGNAATMEQFDRQAVLDHYRRYFTPCNMVMCLAGGFDFEEAVAKISPAFGSMKQAPPPAPPVLPPVWTGRARAFYRMSEVLPVAEALLCQSAYPAGDARFDAARAFNHLLGGGLSSRLFMRVREELGLVYDIESHLQGHCDSGTVDVFLSVGVENLVRAVGAVLEVVREAAQDGFTPSELERYKETARCGMDMLCDQPGDLADWFARQELLLGPNGVLTPRQHVERQEALTVETANAVARDITAGRGPLLVVVGPYSEADRAALRALLPADEIQPPPAFV